MSLAETCIKKKWNPEEVDEIQIFELGTLESMEIMQEIFRKFH